MERAGPPSVRLDAAGTTGVWRVSRDATMLAAASIISFSVSRGSACLPVALRLFGDLGTACGLFGQKLRFFGFFGRIPVDFVAVRGVLLLISLEFLIFYLNF